MYHSRSLDNYPEGTFDKVNAEGDLDQLNIGDDVILAPICQHETSTGTLYNVMLFLRVYLNCCVIYSST